MGLFPLGCFPSHKRCQELRTLTGLIVKEPVGVRSTRRCLIILEFVRVCLPGTILVNAFRFFRFLRVLTHFMATIMFDFGSFIGGKMAFQLPVICQIVSTVGKSLPTVGFRKILGKDGLALNRILGIDCLTPTYFDSRLHKKKKVHGFALDLFVFTLQLIDPNRRIFNETNPLHLLLGL